MQHRGAAAPPAWAVAALTALAYAAVGALSLLLAGPPGYASPLYPPAGIALAATLVFGPAALPGVWLGAFAVNTGLGALRGQELLGSLGLSATIAFGALLQAWLATLLLRRVLGPAPVLDAPAEVLKAGLVGGALACLTSASVGTAALVGTGVVAPAEAAATWATWWLGDTLGVLIAAPLVLSFIGQPAADWRPRRPLLAVPLLLALGTVALATQQLRHLALERQQLAFERQADRVAASAAERLEKSVHAVQTLHVAAQLKGGLPDAVGLREASVWWLDHAPFIQATGVGARVPVSALDAFVAAARAGDGGPDYRVFDRDGGADRRSRGEVLAVRQLEPPAPNRAALGVNSLSVPAARVAIEAARDSGEARVTAPFRLTQSNRDEPGVVFYLPVYTRSGDAPALPTTEAERRQRWQGMVFVTLRTELALAHLLPASEGVGWCLLDLEPGLPQSRLGGSLDREGQRCEAEPGRAQLQRTLDWGGRRYELRVMGEGLHGADATGEAGLVALTGLAAVALLGALLLVVTGQGRRTQKAVEEGTERLRAEVAERRAAEAAEREAGERLQGILDAVPVGILFLDASGHILEWNPRLAEMCGLPGESLAGRVVLELVHPDDHAAILESRRDLLQGRATRAVSSGRLRSGHGEGWTRARFLASVLLDDQRRVWRMVAVVEDMSDQLRLQAAEEARLRAEAANRAKNEFLSRMSHELRTPLNAMIGFAQLLGLDREPALAAHQAEWVRQVQRAGWHLLELINDSLDLSRIESGALSLAIAPLQLPPLVEAARSLVAGAAAQRGVTLLMDTEPGLPAVLADPVRLRQVLTNLLSNAVKYNRPEGRVQVLLARAGPGFVRVTVKDTGLGMDEAQLQRLFQPYDRLGREGSGIEGTGIGLIIVQRLLALMGGTLEVHSQAGQGSSFAFTLPASADVAAERPPERETAPAPYAQRLVHYVEDNETNVEVMRGVLAQRPQVRLAVSMLGLDGLAAMRREPPDLVLLDMQLPDIAGLELLRFLKQDDDLAKLPVIVVSADATPDHVRAALTAGALHYVTKPVAVAEFLALVDEALEAAETRWGL